MKFLTFKFFLILLYLLSSSVSYAIQEPNLKNLFIHKSQKKLENINFKNIREETVSLNNFKNSLILINFWATWCAPCIEELPSLNRLKSKYENNVDIIAINVEKINYKKAESFLKSLNVENFKTYFDKDFRIAKLLKLRGIPITIIVGQDGREVGRVIGSIEFDQDKFINLLKKI